METPDTSLVRRNQLYTGKGKGGGEVESPDTSLVRRNQEEGIGKDEGVVWRLLTRLWSEETKWCGGS